MDIRQLREVDIRELCRHADDCLLHVGAGHEIVVTGHGRPAARLVPMSDPDEDRVTSTPRPEELIGPEEAGDPLEVPIAVPSDTAPSSRQILDEVREERL